MKSIDFQQDGIVTEIDKSVYLNINPYHIKYIVEEVGYWRKEYKVHEWIEKIVGKRFENDEWYTLEKEHIEQLYNRCLLHMENLDDDLYEVADYTKHQLDELFEKDPDWNCTYHYSANW